MQLSCSVDLNAYTHVPFRVSEAVQLDLRTRLGTDFILWLAQQPSKTVFTVSMEEYDTIVNMDQPWIVTRVAKLRIESVEFHELKIVSVHDLPTSALITSAIDELKNRVKFWWRMKFK